MREMFKDIARERARLGGDWAIAGVLFTSKMREIARAELGSDLEIVMLEMTAAEQEERIRARHSGSQHAVNLMKVFFDLFEPVGESEVYTRKMTVSPDLTPQDVVARILGDTPWRDVHYKGKGGFIDHRTSLQESWETRRGEMDTTRAKA